VVDKKKSKRSNKPSGGRPRRQAGKAKPVSKKSARRPVTAKIRDRAPKRTANAKEAPAKESSLQVFDLKGKAHESLVLDPIFQNASVNTNVVYQAVVMYRAGEREGTAATKTRGEVRGGGKKPWRQKGTGRARHGSTRSPIWRSGGTVFGPHPRDYSYALPLQLRRRAVVEVVKDKVLNGKLILVNHLEIPSHKTKEVSAILETFKLEKPLLVVEKKTEKLLTASRNIPGVSVKTSDELNALDVASHRECLMEKAAYAGLIKRLKT